MQWKLAWLTKENKEQNKRQENFSSNLSCKKYSLKEKREKLQIVKDNRTPFNVIQVCTIDENVLTK